jgi:hypothetical protein
MIVVIRNQVEGLLEQGGIKLTAVASDPFGVSGGAMRQLIAKGETNATVLADQAHGRLRKKEEQLKEALAGRLDGGYRFLWKQRLEQVELLRGRRFMLRTVFCGPVRTAKATPRGQRGSMGRGSPHRQGRLADPP